MRTQIEEMDVELEQYHKSNSALELMIQVRAQQHTETSDRASCLGNEI
jgi:hypothetical protein